MLRVLAASAAAAMVLAACSGAPTGPQPFAVPTATTPASPSATQTPAEVEMFGPRVELPGGLLLKQLGKVAQYGGPDDQDMNTFGVRIILDKIAVDPPYDRYVMKPERGHRLVLSLRVETSPTYNQAADGAPQFYQWSTISSEGISEAPPSSALDCHATSALTQTFRPSAKYRGDVTVETANVAGQLVLADFAVWNYPA